MSGKHSQLLAMMERNLSVPYKRQMVDLARLAPEKQYIKIYPEDSYAYQVCKGSGMGLVCSGEISDECFAKMVEVSFAVREDVMQRYSIHFYGRFKDDGLIIASGEFTKRLEYVQTMRKLSSFFQIEVESSSSVRVVILDLQLSKEMINEDLRTIQLSKEIINEDLCKTQLSKEIINEDLCKINYEIHVKRSTLRQPLAQTSWHPMNIHTSWPMGQVQRY